MKIRRSAGALTAAVALSLLAACGGGNAAAPSSPGGQGGRLLVIDTAFQLKTTDPARMFEPSGLLIDQTIYDTLLTFKGGDVTKPVPALASSFTASDDAKTFTFKLRPEAKFSDGTPVTSADVVFSLNRVKNVKGNPSFLMAGLYGHRARRDDRRGRQRGAEHRHPVHPAEPRAGHRQLGRGQEERRHATPRAPTRPTPPRRSSTSSRWAAGRTSWRATAPPRRSC